MPICHSDAVAMSVLPPVHMDTTMSPSLSNFAILWQSSNLMLFVWCLYVANIWWSRPVLIVQYTSQWAVKLTANDKTQEIIHRYCNDGAQSFYRKYRI